MNSVENSKRIAKNTLLLYVRMLFLMLISLYTSRVILNALGVEDYGIYNVVGGVVTMFSVLSGTLSAAISRFITFELGKGDKDTLIKVFSASVTIQVAIAFLVLILAETVGVWFLNGKMIIPATRLYAANWCFQLSVITFCVNLISVPYNAAIIAHERMSAFAYISILEAVGKLLIAFMIVKNPIDRLIFFGGMMAVLSIIIRIVYGFYCKRNFVECTYHFVYDHNLLKRMFGFAGWNFIGASSSVFRNQGSDIILNIFFGPTVNAARGIAVKVDSVITQFVSNFMMALNPQITKSYASGNTDYMFKLIFGGSRYSYYILLLITLPILFNTHYLLVLWLRLVPEHTVLFVKLILLLGLSECISLPLITAMLATGNIRNYQIVVGGIQLLNLPISYSCLYMGAIPESVVIVALVLSQIGLFARVTMLNSMIGLHVKRFFREVYCNLLGITFLSSILPYIASTFLQETFVNCMIIIFLSLFATASTIMLVGCSKSERKYICQKILIHVSNAKFR